MNKSSSTRAIKITIVFIFIAIGFVAFLSVMFYNSIKPRNIPSKFTYDSSYSQRGSIISEDGFHLAVTQKLYKAIVNTKNINPDKKDVFIKLFSIYSNIDPKIIEKKLNKRRGSVVLSYAINPKEAQYLKSLAYELLAMKVFVEYETKSGRKILHGLNIIESGERRIYPYKKLLTPLLGFPRKKEVKDYTKVYGVKGVEKFYEDDLHSMQDGYIRAPRDVNGHMILNKKSFVKFKQDGSDIVLNIPVTLQIKIEGILDNYKKKFDAKEVLAVIMESKSGKIKSLASSNRYLPTDIKKSEYTFLNNSAFEYSFEIGSVMKPITFALLLEQGLVNPYDLVYVHNGRYKIGKKVITDEHEYDWLSAENVIVHSSNIGTSIMAQKLHPIDFHSGLKKFGFSQKSKSDVYHEKRGSIPSIKKLHAAIYKATTSYGYGMRANLIQLVRAYNTFNNDGKLIKPLIVKKLITHNNKEIVFENIDEEQVISPAVASKMKHILIKTVLEGTGKNTIIDGLEIGGKTGTAHIAHRGKYVNRYNSSFIGFANDKSSKYTIGVTVVEPKKKYFASQTAVVVFRDIVQQLVDDGLLVKR
ncbi:MAG: penicillin-binding protein 2 [Campylobacterota bacterium]|nr:penicillin-binding protein 2 [Campylobacterota bacterium]